MRFENKKVGEKLDKIMLSITEAFINSGAVQGAVENTKNNAKLVGNVAKTVLPIGLLTLGGLGLGLGNALGWASGGEASDPTDHHPFAAISPAANIADKLKLGSGILMGAGGILMAPQRVNSTIDLTKRTYEQEKQKQIMNKQNAMEQGYAGQLSPMQNNYPQSLPPNLAAQQQNFLPRRPG